MSCKSSNPNCNGNRRDKVALRTICDKNIKFKIVKIRTNCHVGYFYYSENLNWAEQNLRQGRGLGIAGLFNARRLWKGVVTAHTLVGVQHQRCTVAIQVSGHGHKLLSSNAVIWPHNVESFGDPKASHKEPGGMLLRGARQSMCRRLSHTLPRFHKNMLKSKNLVCSATTGTKTALGIIRFWFSYFAASFFKALGNVNVNYLKILRKHRWPHKTRWPDACGPRVWDPWSEAYFIGLEVSSRFNRSSASKVAVTSRGNCFDHNCNAYP